MEKVLERRKDRSTTKTTSPPTVIICDTQMPSLQQTMWIQNQPLKPSVDPTMIHFTKRTTMIMVIMMMMRSCSSCKLVMTKFRFDSGGRVMTAD